MPRSEPDQPQQQPFTRPLFIVSASFLAAILILAVVIIVATSGGGESTEDNSGAPAPSDEPSQSAPSGDDAPEGSCPAFPKSSKTEPTSAPDAEWSLFSTVALPSSVSDGPAKVDGDVGRCFARTPTGAMLASIQVPIRVMHAADWRPVTELQTTGPGKKQLIKVREDTGPPPEPDMGELGQIAGFRIVTYSPDTAVVEIVTRFADTGTLQVTTNTMKWSSQRADWQYELTKGAPSKTVDDLTGYVPFSGV